MSELIVLVGASGSGKSFVVNERYYDYEVVSPDSIREELDSSYAISGPGYSFDYDGTFGTKLSVLKKTKPELSKRIEEMIPEEHLKVDSALDAVIFRYAFALLREKLNGGKNVVMDSTCLNHKRWNPMIEIGRQCNATIKALWLSPCDFKTVEEFEKQILKNNNERHGLDALTGKPKGRFTPIPVLRQMIVAVMKLEESPPPLARFDGDKNGFDEVIKVPVKKR